MGVLGETILVGWRSASQVDSVDLGGEGGKSARTGPDLLSVVGSAGAVDVEAGDDLGDGVVEAEDDLNVAGWVL